MSRYLHRKPFIMVSAEHMTKVADWRQKARDGVLTQDEMREAITFLRAERVAMPASTTKVKLKVNTIDLLSELDNL